MVRKNLDESGLNRGYDGGHEGPDFGEVQVDIKEYIPLCLGLYDYYYRPVLKS